MIHYYDYIQIILESGKELTVTNEHGVIVLDDKSNKRVIKANNLKEGQIFFQQYYAKNVI